MKQQKEKKKEVDDSLTPSIKMRNGVDFMHSSGFEVFAH